MDSLEQLQELTGLSRDVLQVNSTGRVNLVCRHTGSARTVISFDNAWLWFMQSYMRDSMRQTLITMSPNLNIPQHQLLHEFDKLFPEQTLLAEPGAGVPFVDSAGLRARNRLIFQHDCE